MESVFAKHSDSVITPLWVEPVGYQHIPMPFRGLGQHRGDGKEPPRTSGSLTGTLEKGTGMVDV